MITPFTSGVLDQILPSAVTVITTIYDSTGKNLGPIDSILFGKLAPGETSEVQIINLTVTGVSQISNVKIGLIGVAIGGFNPATVFQAGHSQTLGNITPSGYFPGLNEDETGGNPNNVLLAVKTPIGVELSTQSDYVYLSVTAPGRFLGTGVAEYKWFFDYES